MVRLGPKGLLRSLPANQAVFNGFGVRLEASAQKLVMSVIICRWVVCPSLVLPGDGLGAALRGVILALLLC